MKQHIYLPKSTLKEFMVNNRLYYLDLELNLIKYSTAKGFNTIDNYYPNDSEAFLSKEVETRIGTLRRQVKEYEQGRSSVTISPTLTEQLIRIFIIQLLRLPDLHRYARSKSVFASIFGLPESFYSPLHHGVEALKELIEDSYSSITSKTLKDYSTNIIEIVKERRARSFLLPSSHFIGFGKYLILVLTPYWGVLPIPESENRNMMHEGLLRYLAATSDNEVDLINMEAEKYESTLSNQKLVGLLPELEILKQKRA